MDWLGCMSAIDGLGNANMHLLSRRRTYKPHEITWDSIAAEATGKQFLMSAEDKEGRQIVVMRPR